MFKRKYYEDTLLVTFDVVNLYINIPHTFGQKVYMQDLTKSCFTMCKIILQNNNMKFNNKYNQIKGTAMGKIFAPTYATLSMRYFEIKFYSICTFKYGELLAEYIKKNWNRFLMTAIRF